MRLVTDIRGEWPQIKPALEALLSKSPDEWIPEDVYHALKSGSAAAYQSDDGLMIV